MQQLIKLCGDALWTGDRVREISTGDTGTLIRPVKDSENAEKALSGDSRAAVWVEWDAHNRAMMQILLEDIEATDECPACKGSGTVFDYTDMLANGGATRILDCPDCDASGKATPPLAAAKGESDG